MIALLRGVVAARSNDSVVVDVQGVGYEVFVPAPMVGTLSPGTEISMHIHTSVREDAITAGRRVHIDIPSPRLNDEPRERRRLHSKHQHHQHPFFCASPHHPVRCQQAGVRAQWFHKGGASATSWSAV